MPTTARRRGEPHTRQARRLRNMVALSRGTRTEQRQRESRAVNASNRNAAFTGSARSVDYRNDNPTAMQQNWSTGTNVQTYTSTPGGRLSINGRNTSGAKTWAQTPKNDDGTPVLNDRGKVRQSGRSQIATRSQRDYDVKSGMNNISPRVVQAWLDNGLARVVNGGLQDVASGNVIRQKRNGNYTMGLSIG